jgi:hypothetical protein
LEARVQSFELAYRMQMDATDAFDISREPESVRKMYGDGTQARQLFIARRLARTRGAFRAGLAWRRAAVGSITTTWKINHRKLARESRSTDRRLLKDLKQRGMLDDTLVIWGGEFGRTPTVELPTAGANAGKVNGRDHNHSRLFTCGWPGAA